MNDTTSNTVQLLDQTTPFGLSVDFGTKAKTRIDSNFLANEDGSKTVDMVWAFRNGNTVSHTFFVPAGGHVLAAELQVHGIQQKIGDCYSKAETADDVEMIVRLTLDNLNEGRWVRQQASSGTGIPGLNSDLVEAVRRTYEATKPEAADEGGTAWSRDLLTKYYTVKVIGKVQELQAAGTVEDLAAAEELMKKPFAQFLGSASVQEHLAAIKQEKAKAAADAKRKANAGAGDEVLGDLFDL